MTRRRVDPHVRPAAATLLVVALAIPVGLVFAAGASGPQPWSGAPISMAVASTLSTGNTGNTGTATGTTTTTSTLPPAPVGYAASWTALYDDIYGAVEATGITADEASGTPLLPSPATFAQMIAQLTPGALAQLYQGTSSISGWRALPSTYTSLTATAQAQPVKGVPTVSEPVPLTTTTTTPTPTTTTTTSTASSTTAAPSARVAAATPTSAASSFPPAEPSGSFPSPLAPYQPSAPIGPTQIYSCPAPAPGDQWGESTILGATIAAQVLDDIEPTLEDTLDLEVSPPPVSVDVKVPNPVLVALAIVAGAAHVVADTFQFLHDYWANCLAANLGLVLANLDNTTVNTYDLATLMESTLNNTERSIDTVSQQVNVIQQTEDDQLTLDIQQALTAPAGSPPNVAYETPASAGGNLDSTPIGVQEVVTQDLLAAQSAGIEVNPAANQDLAAANVALAAHQYKTAYADFHAAYLEVAQ